MKNQINKNNRNINYWSNIKKNKKFIINKLNFITILMYDFYNNLKEFYKIV